MYTLYVHTATIIVLYLYTQFIIVICTVVLDENLRQIWVVNLATPLNFSQAGTVPHTYVDSQSTGLVTTSCDPSRSLAVKGHVVPTTTGTFGQCIGVQKVRAGLLISLNLQTVQNDCMEPAAIALFVSLRQKVYLATMLLLATGNVPLLVWHDVCSLDYACVYIKLIIQ